MTQKYKLSLILYELVLSLTPGKGDDFHSFHFPCWHKYADFKILARYGSSEQPIHSYDELHYMYIILGIP